VEILGDTVASEFSFSVGRSDEFSIIIKKICEYNLEELTSLAYKLRNKFIEKFDTNKIDRNVLSIFTNF